MSDDKSTSIINFGELSKPANTLIKKVSSAVGGVFEPWQIKRLAKAEAEASLIRANADIQVAALHRRAIHRFIEEEANRQENMEEITTKSLPHLSEDSDPTQMEDDWVTNFFERSRIISDEQMQNIWARVLAGEANRPGSYSKRTINLLSDLDKRDAERFQALCRFCWLIGDFVPLIFDSQDSIYSQVGINFSTLTHLDNLGLVNFNGLSGFRKQSMPKRFVVTYCGRPLELNMKSDHDNHLDVGNVIFTQAGRELASITNSPKVEGFFEYVKEQWSAHLSSSPDT